MTGLHNTDLTTSQKVEFSAKALANQGLYGSVTQLSHEYEISIKIEDTLERFGKQRP